MWEIVHESESGELDMDTFSVDLVDGSYTVVVLAKAALALCDRICRVLAHQ